MIESAAIERDEISLLALMNVALRRRRLVVGLALLFGLVIGVMLLVLPRWYTANSSFIVQARKLPTNISGLAAQFGLSLPGADASQSPAFYQDLLDSREILSAVVDTALTFPTDTGVATMRVQDVLRTRGPTPPLRREATIKRLGELISASNDVKTGIVSVSTRTHSPGASAAINRRLLDLLNAFNLSTRQSQASAERKFTERRLAEVKQELETSEDDLRRFNQRNREYRNSPDLSLEQDRLNREVNFRQQVFATLAQAFEQAKIEEVRDTPVITILQQPEPPVRPDSRQLVLKVLFATFGGAFVGLLIAMLQETLKQSRVTGGGDLEEFDRLRRDAIADLRHPLRALRAGGNGAGSES
ncbi:MAG: Wzz/FepE/Etk N-terminal domain-containing protein [Gemmatimonadota bacterium]